jgi:hypothetical protein
MAASEPPAIITSASLVDDAKGIADGVGAGGASRRGGFVGSFGAGAHGNVAGREVDDGGGNKKWRDLARAAFHQSGVLAFDDVEPADPGPDVHADALVVFGSHFQA